MAFISQAPKYDADELASYSIESCTEENVCTVLQEAARESSEGQIDAFEALRHSFRPKDDFSERMQALVKNMAEPMIRNWLEKHMMGIVEGLVRVEIERATRDSTPS